MVAKYKWSREHAVEKAVGIESSEVQRDAVEMQDWRGSPEGVCRVEKLSLFRTIPFGQPCAEKTNSSALFLGFETQDNKL
jgi:hypothetical protein